MNHKNPLKFVFGIFLLMFTINLNAQCDDFVFDGAPGDCNSSGTFFVNAYVDNLSDGTFSLFVNDELYETYSYQSNDPIFDFGPFTGDCISEQVFRVVDNQEGCTTEFNFGVICCEAFCSISDIEVTPIECTSNDTYSLTLDFNHTGTEDDYFSINANGEGLGEYLYSSLPVTIDNFPSNGNGMDVLAVLGTGEDSLCGDDIQFEGLDCNDQGECTIDFEYSATATCDNNYVTSVIFVYPENNPGGTGFNAFINGQFLTFFSYDSSSDNSFDLGFMNPNSEVVTVLVCDNENTECCSSVTVDNPCFAQDPCTSFIVDYVGLDECNSSGTYFAEVLIDGPTGSSFNVYIDDELEGTYNYGENNSVYTFGPYVGDCMTQRFFQVHDNSYGCISEIFFDEVCCPAFCSISDIEVTTLECTSDNTYAIELNFNYQETEEDYFLLYANGDFFGEYLYASLPITIIDFPSNGNDLDFLAVLGAEGDGNCADDFAFEGLDCSDQGECFMGLEYETPTTCDNNFITSVIFVTPQNNPGGTGFNASINGEFLAFYSYNSSSDNSFDLSFENPETQEVTVLICDNENTDCCNTATFANPCFEESSCDEFSVGIAGNNGCNDEGQYFVDLQIERPGGSSFDVYIDDEYEGSFDYNNDDPVFTFGPYIGDCETSHFFQVIDTDLGCIAEFNLEPACCNGQGECSMIIDFAADIVCNDNNITSTWLITTENNGGLGFDVFINEEFVTFVDYQDVNSNLYELDLPNPGTEVFNITVCDTGDLDCCSNMTLPNPCFEEPLECFMDDLFVEAHDCNTDGEVYFDIEFGVANPGPDGQFTVVGNGNNYGTFSYGENFYTVGPFNTDCNTPAELVIYDVNDENCQLAYEFDEIFCCEPIDCYIEFDIASTPVCVNNTIVATWVVFTGGNGDIGFDVFINGEFLTFVDYQGGNNNSYDLEIPNTETETFNIMLCDNDNPDCCSSFEVENPCFVAESCGQFIVDYVGGNECNAEGNYFAEVLIDRPGGSSFDVYIDDEYEGSYDYNSDDPVFTFGPFNGDCETTHLFQVVDVTADCIADINLEPVCCDNQEECFMVLDFTADIVCINNNISSTWLITTDNNGGLGFNVYINEEFVTFVEYQEVNSNLYEFDLPNPGTEVFNIMVCDNDNSDCCSNMTLPNPCFEESMECFMDDLFVEAQDCNANGEIYFDIEFGVANPGPDGQFTVVGNGNNYGTFSYGENFYTVGPFNADCNTLAELVIYDANDENCQAVFEFSETFCCESMECDIDFDIASAPQCIDDNVVTSLVVLAEGHGGVGFDIFINDEFFTFIEYQEGNGNVYDLEIPDPETGAFTIKICDNDNLNCCRQFSIPNPCFQETSCSIDNLELETSNCSDQFVTVTVDADIVNAENDFIEIWINGEYQDEYMTEELPISLEFSNEDLELIVVSVCILGDDQCCVISEIDINCENDQENTCELDDMEVALWNCGTISETLLIDFNYGAEVEDSFNVNINNEFYGIHAYVDLPIEIEENFSSQDQIFVISIVDIDNSNCLLTYEYIIEDCGSQMLSSSDMPEQSSSVFGDILDDLAVRDQVNIKSVEAYDIYGRLLNIDNNVNFEKIVDIDGNVFSGIIILRIDYGYKLVSKKIIRLK